MWRPCFVSRSSTITWCEPRAKLEQLSVHDDLTGLYNYRYLHTRLAEEFKRAERYHDPLACIVLDIDRLQAINDSDGRAAGDTVIKGVAEAIRTNGAGCGCGGSLRW